MTAVEQRIANLSAEKRARLAERLAAARKKTDETQRIPRRADSAWAPLSSAQQRLWFLDQLDAGSPHYLLPAAVRLEGWVNVPALERSLAEIQRRHEVLRARFVESECGVPMQVIDPPGAYRLPVIDLSCLPEPERQRQADALIRENNTTRFDLSAGPLFLARLVVLSPTETILLLCMHHIVTDGWSTAVLVRELSVLYAAYASPIPPAQSPLPELPIQYGDFAAWQVGRLQGEWLENHLGYWKQALAGVPQLLELPTDFPRPALQSHRGGHWLFELPPALTAQLRGLCEKEGVTLYMALLAAFEVLLYRYSAQDDFCVGTPIANRSQPELANLIGLFVNSLAIRANLTPKADGQAPSFRQVLSRTKQACLDAYSHQDLPFEQIVEALKVERSMSYTPLFQVMFTLQDAPVQRLQLPNLALNLIETENGLSKTDLVLFITDDGRALSGNFEYCTDLFRPETIQGMAEHFVVLLEGLLRQPEQPVSRLPLIGEAERRRLLVDWNETRHGYEVLKCAHQLFEAWAAYQPEAPAVIFQNQALSYGELNRRANRLARKLQAMGVEQDQIVGVLCSRGFDLITAILGVLKAGAAYLPLDPVYPADRIAYMLADSAAPVLVTQAAHTANLPEHNARLLVVDELLAGDSAPEDETDLPCAATPDSLMYVIYTSGSTGRPKGVLLNHRGVCNLIAFANDALSVQPGERTLQFFSTSFDASVWDLFTTLGNGATLVMPTRDIVASGPDLVALIQEQEVNYALLPPSLLSTLPQVALPSLHTLLVGGEACPAELVSAWAPGRRFINAYGPTETTVMSTAGICAADDPLPPAIGGALYNTRLYILDPHMQPVPPGVPGELFIGGKGLARGYHNRPELTAERFLPDPFLHGERMYKTGDRVRWTTDANRPGVVEYLGRLDQQVKVRGFRIELGEIEAALLDVPGVQQAVVTARDDSPSGSSPANRRLVAYLVLDAAGGEADGEATGAVTDQALRAALKARLPEYMVPSVFVVLDAMPLTPNNKTDRKALPAPEQARTLEPAAGPAEQAALDPVDEMVSGIWSQVTGAKEIRRTASFFEIGGHSLLAAQVIARVENLLHVEVPMRALFESPTLEAFTQVVKQALREAAAAPQVIMPVTAQPLLLPLSFSQQRLWFLDQLEPDSAGYNIALGARVEGPLDEAAFGRSLEKLIERHEVLRTAFRDEAGQGIQIIEGAVALPLHRIDLTSLPAGAREEEAMRLIHAEARRPFNLGAAPLLRAFVYRLGDDRRMILLVVHHIVSDGWSTAVMLRDLAELYEAEREGRPSLLPEMPLQYADYAVWQRNWLQGETLERLVDYWRTALEGLPPQLELPTDHPRPAMQSNNGATYAFQLDPALTARLKALCQQEGVTTFMALLAAFQATLFRYTGQTDFAVGTPIANRSRTELEGLIGFFVNTLVLRADLATVPGYRAPGFHDLLGRVRETCLAAYAHQDLPFETLVEAIQPERSLSRNPLFQVMFALQNISMPPQPFPGLETHFLDLDQGVATFDLTLMMDESPDGLSGRLEYNTDLFERETVARLAGHFTHLLAAALDAPDQPVERLPMLSEEETCQLLAGWNNTAAPNPDLALPVHRLVERRALECPAARALFAPAEGDGVSYAQLNARANQLARLLQAQGVTPGSITAFCLERSTSAIVSLLAILKTGAAFLPIDPAYPPERIRFMLSDSAAPLLLTSRKLAALLPQVETPLLILEDAQALIEEQSDENLDVPVTANDLAYVIYTSGSTGQPKGVLVEHRALVNHNLAMIRLFGLSDQDHVLQFASLSFDAAYEEIFPALICGAELIERPAGDLPGGAELMAWVDRYHLTLLDLPTAYWHALTTELVEAKLPRPASLRLVVVGGEKASTEKLALFQQWAGEQVTWLNTYGPTEAAIVATAHCPAKVQNPEERLPIGRPIDNVRAYVLDSLRQPVPQGVAGELYLAGACVARGYLNRPELTAERFLPDPFYPGDKMYRTGDLARWLPDGTLEYAGRVDFQVKIRGFRVEPGEVEAALVRHPAIAQAAVVPFTPPSGPTRLVGYLVTGEAEQAPSLEALRAFLREELPDYMVPSSLVFLAALPLNASGKVDRRALPAPTEERPELESEYSAPQAPAEQTLAAIWQQVLNLPQVGVNDNFFALGGDSILSLQVVARARQAGFNVSPRQIFEHPTIAELAENLAFIPACEPAEQGPVSGSYPLTPIQRWFFRQPMRNFAHWNQSLLLAFPSLPDLDQLNTAITALVEHHDALRTRFTQVDGEWTAEILPPTGETFSVPFVDLSTLAPAEQEQALEAACAKLQASFDLRKPPLVSAGLFWLGEEGGARLFLAAHHLVVDSVSWRVLVEDLVSALGQLRQGQAVALPPKTLSFRRWAEMLPERAKAEQVLAELPFWSWDEAPASLPLDAPNGHHGEKPVETLSFTLSSAQTHTLLAETAPCLHANAEGLLLAALAWGMREWAGQRLFAVEMEHHGRDGDLDLSRTAGWFTTAFPLKLDLRRAETPQQCLRQIKDELHRVPNGGTGFGLLASYHPDPKVRAALQKLENPPVSFNYLGVFNAGGENGGALADEPRGPEHDPASPRTRVLEVTASVTGGQMRVEITYQPALHRPATIRRLADAMSAALSGFLCPGNAATFDTLLPMDFPDVALDEAELGNLLAEIGLDGDFGSPAAAF